MLPRRRGEPAGTCVLPLRAVVGTGWWSGPAAARACVATVTDPPRETPWTGARDSATVEPWVTDVRRSALRR